MTAAGGVLQGLGPVLDAATRLVVLGSFPGVASLAAQQYYGHPRNHFWAILSALWHIDLVHVAYAERIAAAQAHGLGLWDVYAQCRREGSLDSAIRAPQLIDLTELMRLAPRLEGIAHNGGESARAMRHTREVAPGLAVHRLPSTSPANASWHFDRKLAAWRAVFAQHRMA